MRSVVAPAPGPWPGMRPDPEPLLPTVLVVDDVLDVRLSLRDLLGLRDFRVLDTWNAMAALDLIQRERVDVVLTDLYMPGEMDGVGLCSRIANLPVPRPAVIAMSGAPHLAYGSSLQ